MRQKYTTNPARQNLNRCDAMQLNIRIKCVLGCSEPLFSYFTRRVVKWILPVLVKEIVHLLSEPNSTPKTKNTSLSADNNVWSTTRPKTPFPDLCAQGSKESMPNVAVVNKYQKVRIPEYSSLYRLAVSDPVHW
jgi:hypothetical protein